MSRRRVKEYDGFKYEELLSTDSGFIDAQFSNITNNTKQKIPWKSIILAGLLLIVGTVVLIIGILIVSGFINVKYADRMWPMIILGLLMFIPGAYHTFIAYYAYKRVPGYSFDDIPEFD